ncbi:MAG: rhodanese-like domain-containing protein [Sandaracinaceae bacterium]|nr:rhodanese-like domain-containing protein [Sandaracinaceae bacterium]
MRRLALPFAFTLALGLAACSTADAAPSSPAEDPHAMVAEGATLLDVRTPGEFSSGHIEGAVNIPISELGQRMEEVPTDHSVVVYCLSGGRSASAASMLRSHGYQVHDLGPMSAW